MTMRKKIAYTIIITVSLLVIAFFLHQLSFFHPFKNNKPEIHVKSVAFSKLPGWGATDLLPSFTTFLRSCEAFSQKSPSQEVGSPIIHLKASDWQRVCVAAKKLGTPYTQKQIHTFFETWFHPVVFFDNKPVKGLFTGYYVPTIKGSLTKTSTYSVPIYGVPDDLITIHLSDFDPTFKHRLLMGRVIGQHRLIPYHTTKEINHGAITKHAPVIAWVKSPVDRLFLQIQGSGIITLSNGEHMHLDYAAQNGAPYTAIGRVLIERGALTKKTTSMQSIRHYLETHPEEMNDILNQNQSFVFFKRSNQTGAIGWQGKVLTPGYSLAIDLNWVPIGTPIWLNTTLPNVNNQQPQPFRRLMIAQDTGGAIRGPVRGDVFWGAGEKATSIAGIMQQRGYYWLLLPNKSS
jgi:membrane-bound lytic murein transglycosylase A